MRRLLVPPALSAIAIAAVVSAATAGACNPGPKGPSVSLASIDLSSQTVTAGSENASISPIGFGAEISLAMANKAAPRGYRLAIPLASDERLVVLAAGGAAIIETSPIPPGDYPGFSPPSDDQDADADEIDEIEPTPDDGSGEFEGENVEDDQDPAWYPEGDDVESDSRDGSDIASDAFELALDELPDGNWVMISAFDPPLATDANGQSVPVSLDKTRTGLNVSISPSRSAAFPIEVKLAYGFDPDSFEPSSSTSLNASASAQASAEASVACTDNRPEIVVSYLQGRKILTDEFKKWPTSCARYYISVPPEQGTDLPRTKSAARVRALNKKVKGKKALKRYPHWNTSDAKFIPLAEITLNILTSRCPEQITAKMARYSRTRCSDAATTCGRWMSSPSL